MSDDRSGRSASLTVSIPTLDRPDFLRGAVGSVLAQSHVNLEAIVVDNGSATPAGHLLDDVSDARVVMRRNAETIPRVDNYNIALHDGGAPYVAVLADDDEWSVDFAAKAIAVLDEHPNVVIVHTGYDAIDAAGDVMYSVDRPIGTEEQIIAGGDYLRFMLSGRHRIEFTATVLRRKALPSGGFRTEDDTADDIGLLLRMATRGDVGIVPEPLARVRLHADSVSASSGSRLVNDRYVRSVAHRRVGTEAKLRFLDEFRDALPDHRSLDRLARRSLRHHLLVPAARTLRRPSDLPTAVRVAMADTAADRWALVDPGAWKRAVAAVVERSR